MAKLLFLFLLFPLLPARAAPVTASGIYGEDKRQELFEVKNPTLRTLAASSVALFHSENLLNQGDTFQVYGPMYGRENELCETERYYAQPSAAFCSGVLIAPDLVLTAGHCAPSLEECRDTKFAFGYALHLPKNFSRQVPSSEVYDCQEIVAASYVNETNANADFALVRLNRPVLNHTILPLAATGGPQVNDPLTALGYPMGLPLKFATGGNVRALGEGIFTANLDTYSGNSGSPVVNAKRAIEGILIRGDQDFERTTSGCFISRHCAVDGCEGEVVMKTDAILDLIHAQSRELPKP